MPEAYSGSHSDEVQHYIPRFRGTAVPIGVNLSYRWLIARLTYPPWNEFLWLLAKVYSSELRIFENF
jgi:hypothetical protein